MSYSNLLSGFFGAIIGGFVTIFLYWHNRYTSAKRTLINRLTILRHDVWWDCTDSASDIFKKWDESLEEIWILYNSLMDVFPLWRRRSLQRAWEEYKGINKEVMEKLEGEVFDSKMAPKSKNDFLQKISNMLRLLE